MSKNQRVDEGRLEAEHGELDYRDSSDNEEVRRAPMSLIRRGRISVMRQRHRTLNGTNGYSRRSLFRGLARSGIRGGGGVRPPVVPDRTRDLDIEAAGGVVGRNVEHHDAPTPLLPLDRQIMQEAEVITPPRRELTDMGAVMLLSLSYPQEGHE